MPNNQRRSIRVQPAAGYPIRIDLMGNDFIEVTDAVDVSLDGIGIRVPHEFAGCHLEDLAELLVQLPKPVKHSFSAPVRIIHQQGDYFGAAFDEIDQKDFKQLHRYITTRLKHNNMAVRLSHFIKGYL